VTLSLDGSLLAAATGLTGVDYLVVVGFLGAMVAMGIYFSLRQTTSEEYFVGKRNLPPLVVGLSLVATLLSTITYLAAPGDMIQHGLAFATMILSVPFWLAVVLRYWVPFFMRYRLTSVYEYVEMRYSRAVRWLAASLFILMRFGWMGMIIYTATGAVAEMTADVPFRLASATGIELDHQQYFYVLIVALGLVATGYTFLGGIRVVIWTDVIQFLIMMGGALFAIGYVWYATGRGPVDWWNDAAQLERAAPVWFGWSAAENDTSTWRNWLTTERTVFFVVLNAFFWRICTHCSDQVATQRYFSTAGVKEALRSNVASAIADFALVAMLGMVGLALLSFYSRAQNDAAARQSAATVGADPAGESSAADETGIAPAHSGAFPEGFNPARADHAKDAYPVFIVAYMPVGMAGLILAALFAAAMSSIDSGINSISAVVTTDFYRPIKEEKPDIIAEMRVARWATLITGVSITSVAFLISAVIAADPENRNIIDLSIRVFNLFLGPLASIFIAGIFLPWVGSTAAGLACVLGVALSIVLGFWEPLLRSAAVTWPGLEPLIEYAPSALLVTPGGTMLSVAIAAVLGILLRSPEADQIKGHTWWTRNQLATSDGRV